MTTPLDSALTLQTLLNAAVDGIIVIDQLGTVEVFNPAAEKIFGYRAQEVIGRNVSMLMPATDGRNHDSYIDKFLATRDAKIIGVGRDVIGRRKSGEEFPMNLAVGETRSSNQSKFVGLVRDITQAKLVAEQLELVNDELRLIFEQAPTGIIVATMEGHILNANPWVTELLHYTAREITKFTLLDLAAEHDRDELALKIQNLHDQKQRFSELNTMLLAKNDAPRQVKMCLASAGPTNENHRIIALISDRSEEIAKSLISEQARERLAHSDRLSSLGEMASAIAHEINQPLTAINSYALAHKRVLNNVDAENAHVLSAETRDVLQKISTQAQRGAEIVKRIRGFATRRETQRELTVVNQCILAALELTRFSVDASEVTIETDLFPGMRPALVDELQIQQVCINLIRNAIDAMADTPGTLRIESTEEQGNIVVRFADTGPGVDESIKERLFEPFQSVKQGGLGLGLSISHKIIADHKGDLSYSPNRPCGSIFTFTIPISAE